MPGRLLVTYNSAATHVATTLEYLMSFGKFSRWDVSYAHVSMGAQLGFDLNEFDAIFNNYCVRLGLEDDLCTDYLDKLAGFRGIKVLSMQDEYDRTFSRRQAIDRFAFDLVLTCVPVESIGFVYPSSLEGRSKFITVLTGYAPEAAPHMDRVPLSDRSIMIGYRGRENGGRYGRLSFDKVEIGRRMREICASRGISHDIDWTEESRIYGRAWYDFLASCRAVLATESGSNVFDFDGSLARQYAEMSKAQGDRELSYEEFRRYTEPREAEVNMGQISPRVFEAAKVGTPMVLFEGRYSGVVEPWIHYIPLAKDFSNIGIVFQKLDDLKFLTAMADRAYDHLIASGKFSYRSFVERVDDHLDALLAASGRLPRTSTPPRRQLPHYEPLEEWPTDFPRHVDHFLYKRELRRNMECACELDQILQIANDVATRLGGIKTAGATYAVDFEAAMQAVLSLQNRIAALRARQST